jgi:hypothetical protein
VRLAEDPDRVRHDVHVVVAALGQRHAVVQPQQSLVVRILLLARPLLDHHAQVVDPLQGPLGQAVQHFVDDPFELAAPHI